MCRFILICTVHKFLMLVFAEGHSFIHKVHCVLMTCLFLFIFCLSYWFHSMQNHPQIVYFIMTHIGGEVVIPPLKKTGYIGVTVSVGRSVGIHILSGLFLTNNWLEFNKKFTWSFYTKRRCAYSKGLTIACYFTELWPFYLFSYGVGQGAVLGVFIIFSDSSCLFKLY